MAKKKKKATKGINTEEYQRLLAEAAKNDYRCSVCGYNDLPIGLMPKGGLICAACLSQMAMLKEHFKEFEAKMADDEKWQEVRNNVTYYDPDLDWYRYIVNDKVVDATRQSFGRWLRELSEERGADND